VFWLYSSFLETQKVLIILNLNHKSVTKNNAITSRNVTKGDNLQSYMQGKQVFLMSTGRVTIPLYLSSVILDIYQKNVFWVDLPSITELFQKERAV